MKNVLVDEARRLLAAVPGDSSKWPPLRWTISIDLFDALRDELEAGTILRTDITAQPPTFLGLPYDLGWPANGASLALQIDSN